MKFVVIGDLHADPRYDHRRFTDAGLVIAEERPDKVIQIGDLANCDSINDHCTRLEMEGARYEKDVQCVLDAQADFMRPIKARKKRLPEFHLILGNHDVRPDRFAAQNPSFSGVIGVRDWQFERFGWAVHPYHKYVNLGGFYFIHNMHGQNGRGISLKANYAKMGVSVVVGHSHTVLHDTTPFKDRPPIHGIDVGCLIHKDMGENEAWSRATAHKYWRGIWVFDNVKNGDADFRRIRAESFTSG